MEKKKMSAKSKKPYIRKQSFKSIKAALAGKARIRHFIRKTIQSVNSPEDFYDADTPAHVRLYIPGASNVNKIASDAVQEFRLVLDRLARSYISRSCMLAHSLNKVRGISVANLRTVDNFFVAV